MKHYKFLIVLFMLILSMASVSATNLTNETIECDEMQYNQVTVGGEDNTSDYNQVSESNDNCIYVNGTGGGYYNNGTSWSSATKTLDWALHLAKDNDTIYIADGTYNGDDNSKINITKSVNIVGSTNTVFDGLNKNYFFTISDGVTVSISNITFINAFKKVDSNQDKRSMFGSVLDVKNATVFINNCVFNSNRIEHFNGLVKNNYGGAISNFGNMTIINSKFNGNSMTSEALSFAYGSDVYNNGILKIFDSTFKGSYVGDYSFGGSISNDGNLTLTRVVMSDSSSAQEVKGSVLYNSGNCLMINSTIKDSRVSRAQFNHIFGVVYNEGDLIATGCIFTNNSGIKDSSIPTYQGTVNIYNVGQIDVSYSVFLNNNPLSESYADFFADGGQNILDNNWWGSNKNPYNSSKINVDKVNAWLTLNVYPEYSALNIGDSINISAIWKSSNGRAIDVNLIPIFDVSFNTWVNGATKTITKKLANGIATINYNWTGEKGGYEVSFTLGGFTQKALIDVGKLQSNMGVSVNNINYTETLVVDVDVTGLSSLIPTGNVSIKINEKTYVEKLINGKATFNISDLLAGNYTLNIVYMGDSEYSRAFAYKNITVNKCPIYLNISIPEVKIGETAIITVHIDPKDVQIYGYLSVNGKRIQQIVINKEETSINLKNYAAGIYNITVETWGSELQEQLYKMAVANGILKISKYDTNLTINVADVKAGEDAIAIITVNPSDLRGEAILCINGVNTTIFLESEVTKVPLNNLTSGSYNITVYYLGDSKYASSNATTSFKVLRDPSNLTVNITYNDDLTGVIEVKTIPSNCTGEVGVYVNNKFYKLNLTNGIAIFNVIFTKGSNYVYVLYLGDKQYESATWNTTLNITGGDFVLIGENLTIKEQDNSLYHFNLTDKQGNPYAYEKVEITIANKNYIVMTNSNGLGYLNLNLKAGEYILRATYQGVSIENKIIVNPCDLNINIKDILAGDVEVITVSLPLDATGDITFIVDNKIYNKTLFNGIASVEIVNLALGKHTLKVIYSGDSNYTNNTKEVEFNIKNSLSNITIDTIEDSVYGEAITIIAYVTSGASGNVTFTIDNESKTATLINGIASVTFDKVNAGNKTVRANYNGNSVYQGSSNTKEFKVARASSNIEIITSEIVFNQNVRIWGVVNDDATGIVTFRILGLYSPRNKTISNGNASWLISPLASGSYVVVAVYNGDNNYLASNTSKVISLNRTNSILKVNIEVDEEIITFSASLKTESGEGITGNVTLEVGNNAYKIVVVDGVGIRSIDKLSNGNYTYSATYKGTDKIARAIDSGSFEVKDIDYNVILTVPGVKMIYHDGTRFIATLTDKQGNPIKAAIIEITINGKTYTRETDEKGIASLALNLDSGIYSVIVKFKGLSNYTPITKYTNVTIEPTVKGLDVVKMFRNDTQYYAIFTDSQGTVLKNKDITFNINGVFYTRTTNDQGIAKMTINLNPGTYVITAINTVTGEQSGNNITVKSLIEQTDLTKYYLGDSKFQVTLYNKDGSLATNKEVTFNINGVLYKRTSDSNGLVSMAINLRPGEYTVTTTYDGLSIGSKITVLPTLVTKNLDMKYGDGSSFGVQTLNTNGNSLANQKVTFNVNGVFYTRTTNEQGIAKLAINLMSGEYIITSMWNNFQTGNTIKIS